MILLFGGTSDSVEIAQALAELGYLLMVSTATDEPMGIDEVPGVVRRCGRLDVDGISGVIRSEAISLVVDATHPYALNVRANARQAAEESSVPYISYLRPSSITETKGLHLVRTHQEAAELAFSFGSPVLLTTGSNNLAEYCAQSKEFAIDLFVRVLPRPESIKACHDAGISDNQIIAAKGPFSVETNVADITSCGAGVLVAKDSGKAGGMPERLEAAKSTNCEVIIIQRPTDNRHHCQDLETLLNRVENICHR